MAVPCVPQAGQPPLNPKGHHSIKITVDTYYHCMPGSKGARAELDELDGESAPGCTLYAPKGDHGTKKRVGNAPNPL